FLGPHAEPGQLLHRGGAAGTELDPPVGHDVQNADSLGHAYRMVEREHHHAMPNPDVLGALAYACKEYLGRGAIGKLVEKVMLDGPDRIETKPVSQFDLLHRLPVDAILVVRAMGLYRLNFVDEPGLHLGALHCWRYSRARRRKDLRSSNRDPCRYQSNWRPAGALHSWVAAQSTSRSLANTPSALPRSTRSRRYSS